VYFNASGKICQTIDANTPRKSNMDTQDDGLEKGDSGFTCGHVWYTIQVEFLGCIAGNFDGFALQL